jgi:hypothetical protein
MDLHFDNAPQPLLSVPAKLQTRRLQRLAPLSKFVRHVLQDLNEHSSRSYSTYIGAAEFGPATARLPSRTNSQFERLYNDALKDTCRALSTRRCSVCSQTTIVLNKDSYLQYIKKCAHKASTLKSIERHTSTDFRS